MSFETDICLYNLTLRHSDASVRSCVGNFSGRKSQEIVTATADRLIISRPHPETSELVTLLSTQLFGIVRSVANFKIAGSGKDYIALTSDAGNLSIIEYNPTENAFISLFNEPYAKSGMRRLSPGAELVVDPKGRAIVLSAIERNKLIYVVNRDSDNQLTIASPLEANTPKVLTIHTVALDVGYENPQFATIEIDYAEYEYEKEDAKEFQRSLTYYELDLGLNHVVKRMSSPVGTTANYLLQVPGGNDGPSGVIVCSKNSLSYRNLQDDKLSIAIPRFEGQEGDAYVVSGVTHKLKDQFFFLVQTNFGDIFKLELPPNRTLEISYFDSIPLCASLVVLKSGLLYADTEYGDKNILQFVGLGSDEKVVSDSDSPDYATTFERTELTNLSLEHQTQSINPLFDSILTTDEQSTKIYGLTGTKESSALKILQYGLPTSGSDSQLPHMPNRIWSTKLTKTDTEDKYVVISYMDSTSVLAVGETLEEIFDSGFTNKEETIGVQQIGKESLAQIHSNGIKVIKNKELVNEWQPPAGIKILTATSTNRQIAIGLSNHELVYFEIDENDRLVEWNERKEMSANVTSMSLGEIPEGLIRSPFLILGDQDQILRVLSTDPASVLEMVVMQSLSGVPTSIVQCFMNGSIAVNVGLDNGVYARTLLDPSGHLHQTRTKYLGSKPVILSKVLHEGENVVLAFSNKTWAISEFKHMKINPVLITPLRFAANFTTGDGDGIVGIYKRNLTISTIDGFKDDIHLKSVGLQTTPKRLLQDDSNLYVLESGKGNVIEKFSIEAINTDQGEEDESETHQAVAKLELEQGEKILASALVKFESNAKAYLVVSIATDFKPNGSFSESYIHTYTTDLELVHKTKISDLCHTMASFQGKLVVSVKDYLRLYDIGSKQMLSKAVTKLETVTNIIKMDIQGPRIAIGDIRESVTFVTYNSALNSFVPFVDDVISRHVTSLKMVDYNSVIGGDRFGNLFMLRCSDTISKSGDDSSLVLTKDKLYNGAPYKFENVCNFFLGDVATSFNKGAFTQGGRDVVSYTGLQGTVGVLIPLLTRSDIKFFKNLEKAMRAHVPNLIGRMHLQYRGYYQPVKNVVDGDLIESFNDLSDELKEKIADEVDKKVDDISGKIFDVRALSI